MVLGEGIGAAQSRLLAIGDQKDDIVPGCLRGKGASHLENHDNARAVIADTRTRRNAVVMRAYEDGFAAVRSLVDCNDVLNRGAARVAPGGAALKGGLNFRRVAGRSELGDDPIAHHGVFRRTCRMRPLLLEQCRQRFERMFFRERDIGRARRRDQLR